MSHAVVKHEVEDVLGNQVTVIPLSSRTVEVSITEDDRGTPATARVILTLEEIEGIADAARKMCKGEPVRPAPGQPEPGSSS